MITRKNKKRLMALCPGHTYERTAMNEALLALWAIRVLDSWGKKHGCSSPAPLLCAKGTGDRAPEFRISVRAYSVDGLFFKYRVFSGASEDHVRTLVACGLVIEDFTLDPMPGLSDEFDT